MAQIVAARTGETRPNVLRYRQFLSPFSAALTVSVAYYVGAKIGFALTFQPHPVSTLWPPNSILFASLVLLPRRWWWFVLLAVFPAHLLVQVNADVPAPMILCWFISNCTEAVIGASTLRYLTRDNVRFNRTHDVTMLILASLLGVFLSSFVDSGFVLLNRFGNSPYWDVFRMRFFSNILASLTLVPLIVTWTRDGVRGVVDASLSKYAEAVALAIGLVGAGVVSFGTQKAGQNTMPALLYLPLPFLFWATIRFGPVGASSALVVVSLFTIWGAIHELGPFTSQSVEMNALSVQLFLILTSMPMLFLAALIKERERAQQRALEEEERLEMALDAAQMGTWDWRIPENITNWSAKTTRIFGITPNEAEAPGERLYSLIHHDDVARVQEAVNRAIRDATPYDEEFRVPLEDGTIRWVRGVGKVIFDNNGQPLRMMGVNLDVTERRRAQEKAWETSERNRAMLRALPDMVFLFNADGVYLDYHARDPRQLVAPPAEFIGKNVREILPPDLAERVMDCLKTTRLTDAPQVLEYSLPLHNEERHYEARLIRTEGNKTLTIVRDVTGRRLAARALRDSQRKLRESNKQVRELLGRLIEVQESERRRMSRELHDDLSQQIAALSINISRLKKKLPMSETQLIGELDELREHINGLTDEIRNLSHRLHPAVLEHLGLVSALESYIQNFKNEEQIEVTLTAEIGDEKVPFQTSICMYRVAVEALRNVSRHSGASAATVSLKTINNCMELEVSDRGKGFDIENARKGGGLGLVSIEERLRLLQGSCEIHSIPNSGTTLVARVPITN